MSVIWAITAIVIVAAGLLIGLVVGWRLVGQVERQLIVAPERTYTIYIAPFPDPLILQYGVEAKLTELPRSVHLRFAPWGEDLDGLLTDTSCIVYANRTAALGNPNNARITAREKALCVYQGFAICCRDGNVGGATIDPSDPLAALKARLQEGKLLVRRGTDQHAALEELLNQIDPSAVTDWIEPIDPEDDLLERALELTDRTNSGVVGFVGGITERLVAEKVGFHIIASQPDVLPQRKEVNVLVYLMPDTKEETEDIDYILGQAEAIWSEAVRLIVEDETVRNRFRRYLNRELRSSLGPKAKRALKGSSVVSPGDMNKLLGTWLQFPSDFP